MFLHPEGAVVALAGSGRQAPTLLRLHLDGGARRQGIGLDPLAAKANYFVGNEARRWTRDVPMYGRIRYADVYPGIDVIYYGSRGCLEYDFVVQPGSDPSLIQLAFQGANRIDQEADGRLTLVTESNRLTLKRPEIYQIVAGRRESVSGNFTLKNGKVGFAVQKYDRSKPLVIDPVLLYSSFLGGVSGSTNSNAIALDAAGSFYVTGQTASIDFPISGAAQPGYIANYDAFVAKFTSSGTLVYATYLGGESNDQGTGIAVDANNSAYITGSTSSTTFPTVNASQGALAGNTDAFLTKLGPAGNTIAYSTYFGGSDYDSATGVAVIRATGDAFITGQTYSTNLPLLSPYQSTNAGSPDAFIARFTTTGVKTFATYFGGFSTDIAQAIAVDAAGNCFITGYTYSSSNFPTTAGALRRNGPNAEAFVTKFNGNGSGLVYSTLVGGSGDDFGRGITVHSSGTAMITGYTTSADLPTTPGVAQPNPGGSNDAFVARLASDGSSYLYLTYLGGEKNDQGNAISVEEPSGAVYVTGSTQS
jgi:hypothetical protein